MKKLLRMLGLLNILFFSAFLSAELLEDAGIPGDWQKIKAEAQKSKRRLYLMSQKVKIEKKEELSKVVVLEKQLEDLNKAMRVKQDEWIDLIEKARKGSSVENFKLEAIEKAKIALKIERDDLEKKLLKELSETIQKKKQESTRAATTD